MDNINSSNEFDLISSLNLQDNGSVDVSRVENELERIHNYKKIDEKNIVKILEDCITNSTLSINDLIRCSKNSNNSSKLTKFEPYTDEDRIKRTDLNDKENSLPDTTENNNLFAQGEHTSIDTKNISVASPTKEETTKKLTININNDKNLNIDISDDKLNIVIKSQQEANNNGEDIKMKIMLLIIFLLLLAH